MPKQGPVATKPQDDHHCQGPTMFNKATGMRYYDFMAALHNEIIFDWYMEIGCRSGDLFAPVRGKTVAVDPYFRIDSNVIGVKPSLFIFQDKSDDFFASKFLEKNDIRLSVSFLDGMHLFEYLLRDIINTERNSDKDGLILLHDCVPSNEKMTTRDLENIPRGGWTGDVWKIIPTLQKHRPDLTVTVLDCKPTGIVVISGLNPDDTSLSDHYDSIVAELKDVPIADYGIARFGREIDLQSAEAVIADGFSLFRNAPTLRGAALKPRQITP